MSEHPAYPWAVDDPEPTTLVALWPGDSPPMMTEITAAFGALLGDAVTVVEECPSDDPAVLWSVFVALPGVETQLALWSEPVDRRAQRGARPRRPVGALHTVDASARRRVR